MRCAPVGTAWFLVLPWFQLVVIRTWLHGWQHEAQMSMDGCLPLTPAPLPPWLSQSSTRSTAGA